MRKLFIFCCPSVAFICVLNPLPQSTVPVIGKFFIPEMVQIEDPKIADLIRRAPLSFRRIKWTSAIIRYAKRRIKRSIYRFNIDIAMSSVGVS